MLHFITNSRLSPFKTLSHLQRCPRGTYDRKCCCLRPNRSACCQQAQTAASPGKRHKKGERDDERPVSIRQHGITQRGTQTDAYTETDTLAAKGLPIIIISYVQAMCARSVPLFIISLFFCFPCLRVSFGRASRARVLSCLVTCLSVYVPLLTCPSVLCLSLALSLCLRLSLSPLSLDLFLCLRLAFGLSLRPSASPPISLLSLCAMELHTDHIAHSP